MAGASGPRGDGRRLASSVFLLGRLGVHGELSRDEAVYAYAGQQLAHGVAPYSSILTARLHAVAGSVFFDGPGRGVL